jgi:group I intron endonuclease
MFTIYFILNDVNDKVYVGQTATTTKLRFQRHTETSPKIKTRFKKALTKYGKEHFRIHEIGQFETREEVNHAEKLWILLLRSSEPQLGYNSTLGGENSFIPNDETRSKMRLSKLGENNNFYGRKHTAQSREKTSKSMKGNPRSPETRKKIGLAFVGKPLSKEHCDKKRVSALAYWEKRRAQEQAA